MYSNILKVTLCWIFLFAGAFVRAQTDHTPDINAQNVDQLTPVTAVDFDTLPPEAGEILNGRVFVSADSRRVAVVNRSGQVVILDDAGQLLDVMDAILTEDGFPATFIDGTFDPSGDTFAALHTAGSGYFVTLHHVQDAAQTRLFESDDRPTAVWLDTEAIWLEVVPNSANSDPYIVRITTETPLTEAVVRMLPFAPAQDDAAAARIGRLPPPFAVTTAENGIVSRWNLSKGVLTAAAQVNEIPIYGALTPDGRYLAWRDPASAALHLLDFETSEDHVVVSLNGIYVPFILLTVKADVIIGVDINDAPIVVAWDTQTGQRHELGLYRQCGRPPDMVALNADGQALVIGCDQGLEIWRVNG